MMFKKYIFILLFIFALMPVLNLSAATTASTTEKGVAEATAKIQEGVESAKSMPGYVSVKKFGEWIIAHTPDFIKSGISTIYGWLEQFRTGSFNSKYIFYPILFILVFWIIRYVWNFFFY